ncbi:MAG: apolipoprotein N-acyltransferase [Deltaproteobacteria bacterium]|nr:apolipoprotein N-acyltransferase [Nannocystaceae bacterium]
MAATGGVAFGLGAPPDGITWLIWLGFAPLVWAAMQLADRSWRTRFVVGWIGGLGVGMVGFPWIAELLVTFADAPLPLAGLGLFAFAAWTAVPYGIWCASLDGRARTGVRAWLWPAVSWVGLATVWPAVFPYTPVIGLAEVPQWLQAAELFGVPACDAQVVLCGALLAHTLVVSEPRARALRIAIALAIPLGSYGLGALRMDAVDREAESAPRVRFGIVQPNVPLMAFDPTDRALRLWAMSYEAERDGAHVVVWPEAGAFPFHTFRPMTHDFDDPGRRVLQAHRLPTIFGAASILRGDRWEYNTVYAMQADGRVTGSFDKTILVPLGEYIPIVDPDWAIDLIPTMSHNQAGDAPARFVIEPVSGTPVPAPFAVGPLVCYEDIFPGFAREVAAQDGGIEAFVNVTIDTWFGDTAEPWEHLALAQWRSVEHRIPMVRSVAAGPSTVIDHAGRIQAVLDVRAPTPSQAIDPERLVVDVALPRNTAAAPTIFARGGWMFAWLCVAATAAVYVHALWRRRRPGGA